MAPSPEVWVRVEAELRKRRRRRFLWWWLPGILLGIAVIRFMDYGDLPKNNQDRDQIKGPEVSKNTPSVQPENNAIDQAKKVRIPAVESTDDLQSAGRQGSASNKYKFSHTFSSITVTHNRKVKQQSTSTVKSVASPISEAASNDAGDPGLDASQPTIRSIQSPLTSISAGDVTEGTSTLSSKSDTDSTSTDKLTLKSSVTETNVSLRSISHRWSRSTGLAIGASRIGEDLAGISGIGFSYGLDLQWYRPIGKTRFGFSTGLAVRGFSTKAGTEKSADQFNLSGSMTGNALAPPPMPQGIRWLHRIDLPIKVHLSPSAGRKGRLNISAGLVSGYIIDGPKANSFAGSIPLRRWQWDLLMDAEAPISYKKKSQTHQFLRLQAGFTELWNAPSAKGSRASLLQWGIRRTFR